MHGLNDDHQQNPQQLEPVTTSMTEKQQMIELLVFIAVMGIQFALLIVMLKVHFH